MYVNVPWTDTNTDTDTKNTAGSTNSSAKLFLIGAASQATNPQTYSHDTTYIGIDGCLYSGGKKVSVEGHTHDSDYASNDHNHSASDISSGTFAGNVVAPESTAYTTNMIRNGVITTVDPGENVSVSYANGSLIFVYE